MRLILLKSSLSLLYIGDYFESWMHIFGPPLPTSQTLRKFQDLK